MHLMKERSFSDLLIAFLGIATYAYIRSSLILRLFEMLTDYMNDTNQFGRLA